MKLINLVLKKTITLVHYLKVRNSIISFLAAQVVHGKVMPMIGFISLHSSQLFGIQKKDIVYVE